MDKKKLIKFATLATLALGVSGSCFNYSSNNVKAASWGAKTLFTTSKKVRGT